MTGDEVDNSNLTYIDLCPVEYRWGSMVIVAFYIEKGPLSTNEWGILG